MADKSSPRTIRLLVGVMIGAAVALIGVSVWMIARDEGSPVWVALAGSMLASFAAIIAGQSKKK